MEVGQNEAHNDCQTYLIDLAAFVRSIIAQCRTVRDIATKLIGSIPKNYDTVYIVCDTYKDDSIKSSERLSRGTGERNILKNPDMKVPYNINSFLSVDDNKEDLFRLEEGQFQKTL